MSLTPKHRAVLLFRAQTVQDIFDWMNHRKRVKRIKRGRKWIESSSRIYASPLLGHRRAGAYA